MYLIDTHCHVHFAAYKTDMNEVICRTLDKGIGMITIGTQRNTSANGLAVAEKYDGMWATVGLHPNHLCEQEFVDEDEDEEALKQTIKTRCEVFDIEHYLALAKHPKCVAIGECGLDYYRLPVRDDEHPNRPTKEQLIADQKHTFLQHVEVATQANLPLVIHCRDAHTDQIELIRQSIAQGKLNRRGVIHCFTGTQVEAEAYIAMGFYISFTGVITFPPRKSENGVSPYQNIIKNLPLTSILTETDAPYLTPVPFRGQRNEPAYVEHVAQKIAEWKGVTLEEVARTTTENAKRLFYKMAVT